MTRFAGVIVGAALLLVACSADRLGALQSDPMATYDLPGALEVRVTDSEGSTGRLGVPSPATVRRTFTVPEGTARDAMDVIAIAARNTGWEVQANEFNGYDGDKTIDGLYSQILIAGIVDDDTVWMELRTTDS